MPKRPIKRTAPKRPSKAAVAGPLSKKSPESPSNPVPYWLTKPFLMGGAVLSAAGCLYALKAYRDPWTWSFYLVLALGLFLRAQFPQWRYEKGAGDRVSWGHLIPGLFAASVGTRAFFDHNALWHIGLPYQIFAFWAIIHAFPGRSGTIETPAQPAPLAAPAPITTADWGLLFGLLVAGQVLLRFENETLVFVGWTLIGLAVLLVLYLRYRSGTGRTARDLDPALERKVLGGILLLAAVMRLPFVASNICGLQNDESNMIMSVLEVSHWEMQSPFAVSWGATPTLPYFITAGFFKVFGEEIWVARFVSILFSFLATWMFFRVVRLYFSSIPALVTTFFFTVSWWTLFHSFSPFQGIIMVYLTLAAFYHFEKALREGRRSDFALCGLFSAMVIQTYVPGRLVPVMLAIALMFEVVRGRVAFLRAYGRHLVLSLLVFFCWITPFLYTCYKYPSVVFGRAQEVNIFQFVEQENDYLLPLKSMFRTYAGFVVDPGKFNDLRFAIAGNPMMDPFMSLFLTVGCFILLFAFRHRLFWLLAPAFTLSLTTNALAQNTPNEGYFHAVRCYIAFPFALLIVAGFMDWLLAQGIGVGPLKRHLRPVLAVLLIGSLAHNVWAFYFAWPRNQGQWEEMGFNQLSVGYALEQYGPGRHLMVFWPAWSNPARLVIHDRMKARTFDEKEPLPILYQVDRDVLFFFSPWQCPDFQERLKKTYPKAQWNVWKNKFGNDYFDCVVVPKAQIQAAQAGKKLGEPLP